MTNWVINVNIKLYVLCCKTTPDSGAEKGRGVLFNIYPPNEKPWDDEWLLEDAAALAAALEPCSRIPDRTLALSICKQIEEEEKHN